MLVESMDDFRINRDVEEGRYALHDVFQGLENVTALVGLYKDALPDILATTEIRIVKGEKDLYMYIDDADGSIVVGLEHLQQSDTRTLYLDIIHELVHVKQHHAGIELFDDKYEYIDRPTEIEAYTTAIKEAQRLGMSQAEILDYLYVEWITNDDVLQLARRCGLNV